MATIGIVPPFYVTRGAKLKSKTLTHTVNTVAPTITEATWFLSTGEQYECVVLAGVVTLPEILGYKTAQWKAGTITWYLKTNLSTTDAYYWSKGTIVVGDSLPN